MNHPHRSSKAFSLIEVMMGATVLVVGFVGLIEAVTLSSEMLDTARKQQIAAQFIDGELEGLQSASWSYVTTGLANGITYSVSIDSAGNATGAPWLFNNSTQLMALAKGFTCSLKATYLRPAAATSATVTFLKVTCTVTWTGNTGHIHKRSTDAYLGMYGLNLSCQKS